MALIDVTGSLAQYLEDLHHNLPAAMLAGLLVLAFGILWKRIREFVR